MRSRPRYCCFRHHGTSVTSYALVIVLATGQLDAFITPCPPPCVLKNRHGQCPRPWSGEKRITSSMFWNNDGSIDWRTENFFRGRCRGWFTAFETRNGADGDSVDREEDASNNSIFFDDFGDDIERSSLNNSPSLSSTNIPSMMMESLQSRMRKTRSAEAAYDAKLARNWRRGNWSVRGFALDKERSSFVPSSSPSVSKQTEDNGNAMADELSYMSSRMEAKDKIQRAVHVSVVAAPTSSSSLDTAIPHDASLPDERVVAVGRTDGSVFLVQLGSEYLTKFMAVPKLVVEQNESVEQSELEVGDELGMTVRVENEWVNAVELEKRLKSEQPKRQRSPKEEDDTNSGLDLIAQNSLQPHPFRILYQFQASELGEAINALVFHDMDGRDSGVSIICTAAGNSGEIRMWSLPPSISASKLKHDETMPAVTLSGVHSDRIVSLKTIALSSLTSEKQRTDNREDIVQHHVLFSASRDGTMAIWDLDNNGELIFSCQCMDVHNDSSNYDGTSSKEKSIKLTCADVSNPTSWDDDDSCIRENMGGHAKDVIFLGTSDGYVIGYVLQDLLSLVPSKPANDSEAQKHHHECPTPNIRFRAHGTNSGRGAAVTAIKCGGVGTIPTSARGYENEVGGGNIRSNAAKVTSSILLTGGEDGSVKQWCVLC